jgi:hypothetical protein
MVRTPYGLMPMSYAVGPGMMPGIYPNPALMVRPNIIAAPGMMPMIPTLNI